jgi:hypothetical protein
MEANPYKAPSATVADVSATPGGLEVTWGRALKVWWSLAWRALLFGGIGGFIAGAIIGAIAGAMGVAPATIANLGSLAGFLISIPIGMWVVRNVLRKSWSDFEIVLVERR